MKYARSMSLLLAGLLVSSQAHANGSVASFAGGVEFRQSTDIAIARQDLYLSPGEVRVDYVFVSRAEDEQTVTIGFPLPRIPATPAVPDAAQLVEGSGGDLRNYVGFGVAVNGRPLIPVLHEFAWLDEKNVTAEIEAAGLPLLVGVEHWEATQALDPETTEALAASRLLWVYDSGEREPAWDYQAVYEWQQTFPPGETAVSIHYRPLLGWRADYGKSFYLEGEYAKSACVDDRLRNEIEADGDYSEVAELDYIATTARNWAGPIGEFNLTVGTTTPREWMPAAIHVAVCPADASTDEQGYRHWSATDFVPEKDIRVFFYFGH
ncbi:DUF4424 family protein [Pelagibacterium limicola]|uniref:DUF4424 family protein n=1 Tax=Pelagibacterium limicola TaxID=2791022 RepID=UPI0018AFB5BC|nr:DUF4424 family protein [Pelagibacterium limicola]